MLSSNIIISFSTDRFLPLSTCTHFSTNPFSLYPVLFPNPFYSLSLSPFSTSSLLLPSAFPRPLLLTLSPPSSMLSYLSLFSPTPTTPLQTSALHSSGLLPLYCATSNLLSSSMPFTMQTKLATLVLFISRLSYLHFVHAVRCDLEGEQQIYLSWEQVAQ